MELRYQGQILTTLEPIVVVQQFFFENVKGLASPGTVQA